MNRFHFWLAIAYLVVAGWVAGAMIGAAMRGDVVWLFLLAVVGAGNFWVARRHARAALGEDPYP